MKKYLKYLVHPFAIVIYILEFFFWIIPAPPMSMFDITMPFIVVANIIIWGMGVVWIGMLYVVLWYDKKWDKWFPEQ